MSAKIRLQRFLAQAGVASRRHAEELIVQGRIAVNGRVVRELGVSVDPRRDEVTCEGNRVQLEDRMWLVLNKPAGSITTASDPEGRPTVLELVGNQGVRLYPVGRLDFNTEGVLLLTNDGELANALMHPSHQAPRIYHVKLKGIVDPDDLEKLRQGVLLDGARVSAEGVHVLGTTEKNTWIEMTIRQGLNHQVHRMMEAIGATVLRLIRVSYSGITVEDLRPGEYRALSQAEVDELRTAAGLRRETVRAEAIMPSRRSRGTLDRPTRQVASRTKWPVRKADYEDARSKAPRSQPHERRRPPRDRQDSAERKDNRRPPPRDRQDSAERKDNRRPPPRDRRDSAERKDNRRPPPRDRQDSAERKDNRRPPPRDRRDSAERKDNRRPPPRDRQDAAERKDHRRPPRDRQDSSERKDNRRPPPRDRRDSAERKDNRRPPPRDRQDAAERKDHRRPPRDRQDSSERSEQRRKPPDQTESGRKPRGGDKPERGKQERKPRRPRKPSGKRQQGRDSSESSKAWWPTKKKPAGAKPDSSER